MAHDNKVRGHKQDKFALLVKTELLRRSVLGENPANIADLAKVIGRSRVATSQAINWGMHRPTRDKICKALNL